MGVKKSLMALWAVWTLAVYGISGCGKALPIGLGEDAPDGRIHAIVDAAREGDPASIEALIEQLDSDDPAVRLFAIRAIERISGRRFAYDHAAGVYAREDAVRVMMEELGVAAPTGADALGGEGGRERVGDAPDAGASVRAEDSERDGRP